MTMTWRQIGASVLVCCGLWANAFAEEVTLKHNGVALRADYTLADGKTAKDGVIMLLHGTFAHNRMEIIKTVSELLNEAGYNTLNVNLGFAIDQRPSAMLDCAIEHRHKHEDAVDELAAWMGWLKDKGAAKVVAFGHSRGGNQTAWFASEQDSDLLEKVVLVAPATWDAKGTATDYETRYKARLAALMAAAQQLVDQGKGDNLMQVPGFVYCENAKVTADAFLSYYRDDARKDTPTVLKSIKKPVLLVMGSADEVVADLPAKLKDFKQDNVSLATIDGADHFFRDLYADDVAEKITGFVGW